MLPVSVHSSYKRLLVWALNLFTFQANLAAQNHDLVNNTIYTTNPRIAFAPELSYLRPPTGQGCGTRYDPWSLETYKDQNGVLQTYHRTSSQGNQPHGDQMRSMSFDFRGASIWIYGAPLQELEKLGQLPSKQEICIQKVCYEINTWRLYNSVSKGDRNLPVLLYSAVGLPEDQHLHFELRLLDSFEPIRAMKVHHLVYQEREAVLP
ncbi:hypothetical protein FRB95_008639 [Tulasnella sp. JGI-2019a]|nr:hypothetical protein FRB95_008639 [Tulasnella sp. JGI-2019a]